MLELASIVILGILAQWVAWQFKIPAILPLILIGLLVGPISTLLSSDGTKWIEPIWNGEEGLFPGESLFYFVSLSISIILFEGGLTLKRREVKTVGSSIIKLISLGSLITFIGAALAVHYIFNISWEISFLFSALIIVTGPTVISPILRNIPLKRDVSAVLKWEGILIDPIGALVAVLVFEFISVEEGSTFTRTALLEFGKIILFGISFGFTFAHGLSFAIKKQLIPRYLLNVLSLATVLGVFVLSNIFAHESGLLAVVVMGMVLGNINLPNIKELLYFKESLSLLLISILFILLSANINIADLQLIYDWKTVLLFVIIVFVIRPLGVFLSTNKSTLRIKEKIFISWVGPRGIVAAGIASLFGLKLVSMGVQGAEFITPLVFMVVLGTVLLNATTARLMAKLLGVFLSKSEGILIIGASKPSRLIAQYLDNNNKHVVLVDTNAANIHKANKLGLDAIKEDIYTNDLTDHIELNDVGYLMALTGNDVINRYVINKFKKQFGENGSFRLITPEERNDPENKPKEGLFSYTHDFVKLTELVRLFPKIHETKIESNAHYLAIVSQIQANDKIIPLFLKSANGDLNIIPSSGLALEFQKESHVVCFGEPFKKVTG